MIAAIQFSLVIGVSFIKVRYGLYFFILFLSFSPRSLGFVFSDGTQSLTFVRMAFPVLVALMVFSILDSKNRAGPAKPKPTIFMAIRLLLALSTYKLISTVLNGVLPVYALEDLLLSSVAFICFYVISTERFSLGVVQFVVLSVILTGLIVIVEDLYGNPLHYSFASQAMIEEDALLVHSRGGDQRVQGIFDNPLSLSEFSVLSLPVVLYFFLASRQLTRFIGFIALCLLIAAIFNTGSRSGVLIVIMIFLIFFTTFNWMRISKRSRIILLFLLTVAFFFLIASAFGLLVYLIDEAQGATFYLIRCSVPASGGSGRG
jgi:hypothetical protein